MPVVNFTELTKIIGCETQLNLEEEELRVFKNVFEVPGDEKTSDLRKSNIHYVRLLRPKDEKSRIPEGVDNNGKKYAEKVLWKQPYKWDKSGKFTLPMYPLQEEQRFTTETIRKMARPGALVLIGPLLSKEEEPEYYRHSGRKEEDGERMPGYLWMINKEMGTNLLLDRVPEPKEGIVIGTIDKVTLIGDDKSLLPKKTKRSLRVIIIPVIIHDFVGTPKEEYGEGIWRWSEHPEAERQYYKASRKKYEGTASEGDELTEEVRLFRDIKEGCGYQKDNFEMFRCVDLIYRKIPDEEEPTYIVKGNKKIRVERNCDYLMLAWSKPEGKDNTKILYEEDGKLADHELYQGRTRTGGSMAYVNRTDHNQNCIYADIYY